ncbi:hypothetical protein BFP70_15610 [Thioclava sp. SK-1]|uniref:hypothetical protein n=1 Tax=Thioclava sp. SK-1 TaxID=1889770 RepID=UPI000824B8D2|nr:hypothetical protein [Thioclava sp. SK-1]OCX61445.1 hypothetical protein BFP70_15610 [Thioclava sp. SK-1]
MKSFIVLSTCLAALCVIGGIVLALTHQSFSARPDFSTRHVLPVDAFTPQHKTITKHAPAVPRIVLQPADVARPTAPPAARQPTGLPTMAAPLRDAASPVHGTVGTPRSTPQAIASPHVRFTPDASAPVFSGSAPSTPTAPVQGLPNATIASKSAPGTGPGTGLHSLTPNLPRAATPEPDYLIGVFR